MGEVCYPIQQRYFAGHDFLTIRLKAFLNLSTADITQIHYTKPDGTHAERPATVENDEDGNPTVLRYDFVDGENLTTDDGEWSFRTYVEFDGRAAYGVPVKKLFECINL